jgi:hypothetical protein
VRVNAQAFARCVREDRPPDRSELAPIRWAARRQAADGIPLEDLIHALRLSERILWHELSDAASPAEPKAVEVTRTYPGRPETATEDERELRNLLDVLCSDEAAAPGIRSRRAGPSASGCPRRWTSCCSSWAAPVPVAQPGWATSSPSCCSRSPRLAAVLRERVLGPLEEYARRRRSDLLATLATFVELDLDRRRAAAALQWRS